MDQLRKLREKKGMHKMRPMEQKAKMGVIEDLRDMADNAMGNKIKGLNKVTVASNDPEGLRHGLDKAKDIVSDPSQMMAHGGMAGEHPLDNIPEAFDDSHPDHENFLHSEDEEDGEDGMSAYPDADGDHLLEMDEAKKHRHDESEEKENMMAQGGEVPVEDNETAEANEEESEMPNYDQMDRSEMSAHLHQLVAAMKRQGLA